VSPATAPDKGALFEARAARLLMNEGAFVRRRVLLEPLFREKFVVTDLDLLSFEFNRALQSTTSIVECKATEARNAPSGADRLLWLAGLRELVHADRSALFVTKAASDPLRRLASELGSSLADERDVVRREQLLGLDEATRFGSHDPRLIGLSDLVRATTKPDRELHRAYWFVRSELWLAPPTSALKRALGACRIVGERYTHRLPDNEILALRWLAGELLTGITLATTRLAVDSYQQPESIFEARMIERLAEGIADFRALEQISKTVDEYMMGVLREAKVGPGTMVQSLGAFAPRPPAYADRLIELINRFAASPRAAADAARLADARFAANMLGEDNDDSWAALDPAETGRLLRLLATFVGRQARMHEELLVPLVASDVAAVIGDSGNESDAAIGATPIASGQAMADEEGAPEVPPTVSGPILEPQTDQGDSDPAIEEPANSEQTLFGRS
jgi:hypothetical protein